MRRTVALAVFMVIVIFGATAASGAWVPSSGGSGSSSALAQGVPTSTAATGTGPSSISIAWAAPTGGSVSPTQYVVRRTAPTTTTVCTVGGVVFTCNDTGLVTGTTYTYTVEARIGSNWSSGQTTGFTGTTSNPTFIVAPGAATKTAGTAFNTTITATTNGVTTDTSYSGVKTITFSGPTASPSGQAPTYPVSVTFASGIGTASIKLYKVETATLAATDGTRSGSASVTVAAGAGTQLGYTASTPPCSGGSVIVGNGGSFTSKVTVYDAYLNPAPRVTSRTVTLTRSPAATGTLVPTSLTVLANTSVTSASFTFTLPVGNPPNTTVTAASSGLTSTACIVKKA